LRHERRMQGVYGYIQKHTGHDNEPLDFYATPEFHQALCNGEQPVGKIFEIYQLKANSSDLLERKMLDETKIILGCNDAKEAIDLYLAHMPPEFMGLVNDLTPEELRHYRYRRDEEQFREDSKTKGNTKTNPTSMIVTEGKSLTSGTIGKKVHFNPNQKRGKDGRWIETGAEKRNATEKSWSSTARMLDKQKGIQAIQVTPQKAEAEQKRTIATSNKYTINKIEKEWGIDNQKQQKEIRSQKEALEEKWQDQNPDDPFGYYDSAEYDKLDKKSDKLSEKLDRDPQRSRKVALYRNLDELEKRTGLDIDPVHAAIINDYMRGGFSDINQALRSLNPPRI